MIDSHVHIWDALRHPVSWLHRRPDLAVRYDLDDLMAEVGDATPAHVVLVQAEQTLPGLRWLLNVAQRHDLVAGVVASVPGGDPQGVERWLDQALRAAGGELLRGVRVSGRHERDDFFERPEVRHRMAAIRGRGLVPHLLIEPGQLGGVARIVEAGAEPVIIDHLGSPPLGEDSPPHVLAEWRAGISALASAGGDVVVKFSGAQLVAPENVGRAEAVADHAFRALGPGRLMFGSDWPLARPRLRYPAVVARIQELLRQIGAGSSVDRIWRSDAVDVTFNHQMARTEMETPVTTASIGVGDGAGARSAPKIVLRSGWQTANIGDVAHAPGALRVLLDAVPDARVTLWPRQFDDRERAMIASVFPNVEAVDGVIDAHGAASTPELARAWDDADLLVHGPAAAVVETDTFQAWRKTGRPYGYLGVSIDPMGAWAGGTLAQLGAVIDALPAGHMAPDLHDLVSDADFVYCRDSLSLAYVRGQGVTPAVLDWAPDATFAFDVPASEDVVTPFLRDHDLPDGGFVCVIPRTRYAPYHRLRHYPPGPRDLMRDALNAAHVDDDLGELVEIITRTVRETGREVLICPEMEHAVELATTEIMPRLPADVRSHVHAVATYWEVHLATAVYARAHVVVSMECHSPILAITRGTPTVYLRLPTETVKGHMFADLGLAGVVVEHTPGAASAVMERLGSVESNPDASARELRTAHEKALDRLRVTAQRAIGGRVP